MEKQTNSIAAAAITLGVDAEDLAAILDNLKAARKARQDGNKVRIRSFDLEIIYPESAAVEIKDPLGFAKSYEDLAKAFFAGPYVLANKLQAKEETK